MRLSEFESKVKQKLANELVEYVVKYEMDLDDKDLDRIMYFVIKRYATTNE